MAGEEGLVSEGAPISPSLLSALFGFKHLSTLKSLSSTLCWGGDILFLALAEILKRLSYLILSPGVNLKDAWEYK